MTDEETRRLQVERDVLRAMVEEFDWGPKLAPFTLDDVIEAAVNFKLGVPTVAYREVLAGLREKHGPAFGAEGFGA